MREVREPIPRVYCCVVIYSVAESRRTRGQSEAAGAHTHSQRHSLTAQLTAQHLTPPLQHCFRLQAHKPAGGASLEKPSPSTIRLRSKVKPRLNAIRAGATFRSFCCFLPSTRISFFFFFSVLGVYWHPFCYRAVSPAQQSSLTSAAYARIGHHVADVRCAFDES